MFDGLFNRRDAAKLASNVGLGPFFHLLNKKSTSTGSGGGGGTSGQPIGLLLTLTHSS